MDLLKKLRSCTILSHIKLEEAIFSKEEAGHHFKIDLLQKTDPKAPAETEENESIDNEE
jgi:hypothetical protein